MVKTSSGGTGKKKSEILGGPGEGGPGEGRSCGRAVLWKGGPGEGRSWGRAVLVGVVVVMKSAKFIPIWMKLYLTRNKCPSRLKWQLLPSSAPFPPRQDVSLLLTFCSV